MEKWWPVSNVAYDKYGTIKMDITAKMDPPQTHRIFIFKYFDKSGVEVGGYTVMGVGYSTAKGQVEHVETYGISPNKINTIKEVIVYKQNEDGTYTGPAIQQGQQTQTTVNTAANSIPNGSVNNNQSIGCNFNPLPALNSTAPFSEALVKSAFYERYSFESNTGGLSLPLAVCVTFTKIQLMDSYKNTVTVVPGRGAQRKHDGATVNATIYRFYAKYIVCRKYNNTTRRTQYENDNVLFKSSNGNWQSGADAVPKIVEL